MNAPRQLIVAFAAPLVLVTAAGATTRRVPQQHPTITEALGKSSPGDTVLVAPGTYKEAVQLPKGVVLRSAVGPDSTMILSPQVAATPLEEKLVVIAPGADRSTVLEGFTLLSGLVRGSAIYCENASPTIRGNVMRSFGWGINLRFSDALVESNVIAGCDPFGISIFASSPQVRRNTIQGNGGRAISIEGKKSKPVIGGRREDANRIFGNEVAMVNGSRNDINARFNDWGWDTTVEMEKRGYPANITSILDGQDSGTSFVGKGKVDYSSWIKPKEEKEKKK